MASWTDQASAAVQRILESGEYVEIPSVPVFDEHEEYDERGKLVRRFGMTELQQIVERCKAREQSTGDLSPIGPGHTIDGAPEERQPPVYGFAGKWHIGRYGPAQKLGILCSFFAKKKHYDDVLSFPRRSIELWLKDGVIDWIALLRRTPQRDLGLLTYSKTDHPSLRRLGADRLFYGRSATLPLAAKLLNGKLRYAMEDMDNDLDPTGTPDVDAPDKEFLDKFSKCMNSMFPGLKDMLAKYASVASGTNTAPPPAPTVPGAGPPPAAPGDDDKLRMSRDSEALRLSRVGQELAAYRLKYARSECERVIQQLEAEGYHLDRAAEVEAMASMDDAGRSKHAEHVRKFYRRAPVGGDYLPIYQGPAKGSEDDFTQADLQGTLRYMKKHGVKDWEEGKAKYLKIKAQRAAGA